MNNPFCFEIQRSQPFPLPFRAGRVDIDISTLRNDGVESGTRYQNSGYSCALTQELVNLIRAHTVLTVRLIYFNDPQVQA
jgi:hypothetical protein